MLIRKATIQDAEGIAYVHVKSWQAAYRGIVNQDVLDGLEVEQRVSLWKETLSNPHLNSPVYVAVKEDGRIIGFASFGPERQEKKNGAGELYAIYLLPEALRQKAGTRLVIAGVTELIAGNFHSMLVWVLAENPSRKFYEQFTPVYVKEETLAIGNKTHTEIAYQWNDLPNLLIQLKDKL
ncbi:GNAT family N-acetyltransferase [Bacillus sp. B-jedd]|uniref:GNAT family N-acetyltransferase n=1 Tax=Bacillus sp. B-jedd TaxID=1476857 RepID=UPI000515603A|nr:GNAT family N-acetyltransferase [Bacillus sp. B-jedd]CEG28309.1 GCN5-related N-acetyltransferase [Bacillus sp. B-jedd]